MLRDIYAYRELIYYFAWREFKVRYKQTAIGVFWVVLQPLLFSAIIVLLLFRATGISFGADMPLIVPVYLGLVFWNYFEQSLSNTANSLVNNQSIITKVYFPRFIPALAAVLATMIDFFVALSVVVVYCLVVGIDLQAQALLTIPLLLLFTALFVFGAGLLFATLNIRFRDVKLIIPYLLRVGLFATPVFYPLSFVPATVKEIAALNPMTVIIESARTSLLGIPNTLEPKHYLYASVATILFLIIGIVYFRKQEKGFADIA